jgi:hypothetical protein
VVGARSEITSRPAPRAAARRSPASPGQVDAEEASAPAAAASAAIRLDAVAKERVVVAEEDERNGGLAAQLGDQLEHARQRRACGERPARRALEDRSVGHRVGERHAELDRVRALATAARTSSRVVATSGSPAVKYGTSATCRVRGAP